MDKFYDELLKRGFEKITVGNYRRVLSKFLRENGEKPSKEWAENYLLEIRKKDYSFSHLNNTATIIGRYMDFIGEPIRFDRPRRPKMMIKEILTEGEIARILAETRNNREKAMIALLAYTGIRNKELCGLKVSDVDLDNNVIRILSGKFRKDRRVYISRECSKIIIEYLAEYKKESKNWLITTLREGKQYNGWALRKMVKVVAKRAKIKKRVYPHLFRHSLATHLLGKGMNIVSIKELLGHERIETTMIYAQSIPKRVESEYNFYVPNYT